jgi:hypothetical protein
MADTATTTKESTTMTETNRHVLITTRERGVFTGILADDQGTTVTLTEARMCTYWSRAMRGVFGLAKIGPDSACRIGPAADSLTLHGVTAICDMTPEAVERWRAEPWG